MGEKKTDKISLTNARPHNWYKAFKKREQEAKEKADAKKSTVTD